jgi:hypothetical protein
MTRHSPTLGAGWAPPPRVWPKIRRQLVIVGGLTLIALFTGILASPRGGLAVLLAWALTNLFLGASGRFRKGLEWAAVAALAVIVATAGAPKVNAPQLKAPVTVDAAQTDQLQQIREGVVNLYEEIARGFPGPDQPAKPKEGDR